MTASAARPLGACGGSDGVDQPGGNTPSAGTPTPTCPTTTVSMPNPTPSSAADAPEYEASDAIASAEAARACDRGVTGKGVAVAVFDEGIKVPDRPYAGGMSPDSTAFDQGIIHRGACAPQAIRLDFEVDGSRLARIAAPAPARDCLGMPGMAPEATIAALELSRPDLANVTPGATPVPGGGDADSGPIAPAIPSSYDRGAFVFVMSSNRAAGRKAAERRTPTDAGLADRSLPGSVSNFTEHVGSVGTITANKVGIGRVGMDWLPLAIAVAGNGSTIVPNGSAGATASGPFRARSPPEPVAVHQ